MKKNIKCDLFFHFLCSMNDKTQPVERHPWNPFIPEKARYLFLGTFPPQEHRWSMAFYYPNPSNDFWRIMGLIFYGDRDALWNREQRRFDLDAIKALLNRERIALWDTGMAVRRLKGNASDKFLEIVEPIDLAALLDKVPTISHIITTGEKATGVIAAQAGVELPPIGQPVDCQVGSHPITLWRMPSTSRAYPLSLEKKADAYKMLFSC